MRTAITGIAAHLILLLGSKIDPSISFRYKSSLRTYLRADCQNTLKDKGTKPVFA
jgi:hypothetical protein